MHLFVSAGEPSGDLHGSNLIRAVQARQPNSRIVGFGGARMKAAGADLLYPLTDLAVMWFGRVLAHLPTFFRLADEAEDYFRKQRPDAVVLIDYPGFHWHIAKRAKQHGIPVYYFVPPQLWAWAGWRVRKMRRTVDTVLTALPFEERWYRRHHVRTHYVGHPYFDELHTQQRDARFLLDQRANPKPVVAILPGSRNQEVTTNLPDMIRAAEKIAAVRKDVRFLIASFNTKQAVVARQMLVGATFDYEIFVGRTPEIIELAQVCLAVSGSVSLELLFRCKPTVIQYRVSRTLKLVAEVLKKCPYITLVNLLAGREIYPEFAKSSDHSTEIAAQLLEWLNNQELRQSLVAELTRLRDHVAEAGACERAADFLVQKIHGLRIAA